MMARRAFTGDSPASGGGTTVVVLELGSRWLRAGVVMGIHAVDSAHAPSVVLPTPALHAKLAIHETGITSLSIRDTSLRYAVSIVQPCLRCHVLAGALARAGTLTHTLAHTLRDLLVRHLMQRVADIQLVVATPVEVPEFVREALEAACLGVLGVASVLCVPQPVAAVISSGKWTGVHVDIGHWETRITAVVQGHAIHACGAAIETTPLGGVAFRAAVAHHLVCQLLDLPSRDTAWSIDTREARAMDPALTTNVETLFAASAAAGLSPLSGIPNTDTQLAPHPLSQTSDVLLRLANASIAQEPLERNVGAALLSALGCAWTPEQLDRLPARVRLQEIFALVAEGALERCCFDTHATVARDVMCLAESICVGHSTATGEADSQTFALPYRLSAVVFSVAPTPAVVPLDIATVNTNVCEWLRSCNSDWRTTLGPDTSLRPGGISGVLYGLLRLCEAVVEACRPETPLQQHVHRIIAHAPVDHRSALASNVVFSGGAACIPGIAGTICTRDATESFTLSIGNAASPFTSIYCGSAALAMALASLQRLEATDVDGATTRSLISLLSKLSRRPPQIAAAPVDAHGDAEAEPDRLLAKPTASEPTTAHARKPDIAPAPAPVSAAATTGQPRPPPGAAPTSDSSTSAAAARLASLQRRLQAGGTKK